MQQTTLACFFSTPRASTLSINALLERKSKTTPRRRVKLKCIENSNNLRQTIIDVGQKNIGLEHCIKCGMIYSQENPKDIKQHEKFHNRFTEVQNFRVTINQIKEWKRLIYHNQISEPLNGTLFILTSTSTATLKRKFEHILTNFVNEEIGYLNELPIWDRDSKRKALIFIVDCVGSSSPFIAGLLLMEQIDQVIVMPEQKQYKGNFLGIERIWVHTHLRRKAIATFLLDSARCIYLESAIDMQQTHEFPRTRVAFSDPTELGIKLAINYANKNNNGNNKRYIAYSPEILIKDTHHRQKKLQNDED